MLKAHKFNILLLAISSLRFAHLSLMINWLANESSFAYWHARVIWFLVYKYEYVRITNLIAQVYLYAHGIFIDYVYMTQIMFYYFWW
jgi:hypothetical protein